MTQIAAIAVLIAVFATASATQAASITVQADKPGHTISKYLTGACLEDVNHEVYGGIYSQMIFGEHFQEPAPSADVKGFSHYGGGWRIENGELLAEPGDGPKLVSDAPAFETGEVGVEVFLADRKAGNAGLIVRVSEAGIGQDNFNGYEISLDADQQMLRLGRHHHDWTSLGDFPCSLPVGEWIPLVVRMSGRTLEVLVSGKSVAKYEDAGALPSGTIGLRQWHRDAKYRNLWVKTTGDAVPVPFAAAGGPSEGQISGMWRAVRQGSAVGKGALETVDCFAGKQSQRITFESGQGAFGIENQSLNRWGMSFAKGKPYEGYLYVKCEKPATIYVALESRDGSKIYAERSRSVAAGGWRKVSFHLTPSDVDASGRFAVKLRAPGSVVLGYAFLQAGIWGQFKGLPVRKDVGEALVNQGITVLRYGGSMINHAEYRWKNMIGPTAKRAPTNGTWYAYSSNGWGIIDFLNFCEAAGFLAIPAINVNESPQDIADLIEYLSGAPTTEWGKRRVDDGHQLPYRLTHIELGNEERVDESYYAKFKGLAEAIWAKDKSITLVVGDFIYAKPITDPDHIEAWSGIKSLDAHRKILALTKAHDGEVWFDLHIGTNDPLVDATLTTLPTFIDALDKISNGAKHRVAVFELNADCHNMGRAIGNALAINAAFRDGRLPVVTSANCLQPDAQNDNGWDQGLLFLNPSQVWYQPPGLVTQMISRNHQPKSVPATVEGAALDIAATSSKDGKIVVLQVVNASDAPLSASIDLRGFKPTRSTVQAEVLSAPVKAVNTAESPNAVAVKRDELAIGEGGSMPNAMFPPYSFTLLRFE